QFLQFFRGGIKPLSFTICHQDVAHKRCETILFQQLFKKKNQQRNCSYPSPPRKQGHRPAFLPQGIPSPGTRVTLVLPGPAATHAGTPGCPPSAAG
uniref:Uncharacterized protein n=1 Tax=Aquila chrysaetos chrysaetos TaxID=223781 RepID=A0A663EPF0_AQUCH